MRIGLIAGGGQFPIIFSKAAKSKGIDIFAVAFHKETDAVLEDYVDSVKWLYLGQVKRLVKYFKENSVNEAVMMGTVKKIRMFSNFRPDSKAISAMAKIKHTHDDAILTAFAKFRYSDNSKVFETLQLGHLTVAIQLLSLYSFSINSTPQVSSRHVCY